MIWSIYLDAVIRFDSFLEESSNSTEIDYSIDPLKSITNKSIGGRNPR